MYEHSVAFRSHNTRTTYQKIRTYVNWGSVNQKYLIWICQTGKKEWCNWIVLFRKNIWLCITQLCLTHWSGFWYSIARNNLIFEINTINEIIFKNDCWVFQSIILRENFTTISMTVSGKQRSTSRVVSDKLYYYYICKREDTWC